MGTKKITLNELRSIVKQIIKEEMVLKEEDYNDWSNYDGYYPDDPPDEKQIKSGEMTEKAHEYIFNKPLSFKKDVFLNWNKNWENKTGINKIFPDYMGSIWPYMSFLRKKFNGRIPNNLVDELVILGGLNYDKNYIILAHFSEKPDEFLKKHLKNEIYNKSTINHLYDYLSDGLIREEIAKFILNDNKLYKLLTSQNPYFIKVLNRIVNKDKIELLKKEFLNIQSSLEKLSQDFNDDDDDDY